MNQTIDLRKSEIKKAPMQSKILCNGLLNPRGLTFNHEGDLLLIEAGAGEFKPPFTGQLTVRDRYTGEIKQTLLQNYRALNMQQRMLRDEIMGLADIAPTSSNLSDNKSWMVSFTDYINGSKIVEVTTDKEAQGIPAFESRGNLNSICYHPVKDVWYSIKPDTNEVLVYKRHRPEKVICNLPDMASGQEAVPVNVIYQPSTGNLLISLFSGELGRGEQYRGIDFAKGAGAVVSVDPDNGEVTILVEGLTLPTAICLDEDENLLVTELCADFLEPLPADHVPEQPLHGGFKRFSGRLLKIDLATKKISELMVGLDTPSNIAICHKNVFISEGMGLPGRPIPSAEKTESLTGFVRVLFEEKSQNKITYSG